MIANKNDLVTAKNNRIALEKYLNLSLPEGEIFVDQAPNFPSGAVVEGHKNGSVITNSFCQTPYPLNCCGSAMGEGIEYFNLFTPVDRRTVICQAAKDYEPGNAVFFWVAMGFGSGTYCTRRRIVSINTKEDGTVFVTIDEDLPSDVTFTYVKLTHGFPTDPYKSGQGVIATADAARFKAGDDLYLTDGPIQGNEVVGSFVDVEAIDPDRGLVYLKRPVFRDFNAPALVVTKPVKNTTFNNITFGVPTNRLSHSFLGKFVRNLQFNNCKALWGTLSLCVAQNCVLDGCTGTQGHNTLTNSTIRNGTPWSLIFEEGCSENLIEDVTICDPYGGQHGIYANVSSPCDRFTVRNVTISNTGMDWGGGHGSPIMGVFNESTFDNVKITSPIFYTYSYVSGDNARFTNITSDSHMVFKDSRNMTIVNVKAPAVFCGWYAEDAGHRSTGRAIWTDNCIVSSPQNWNLIESTEYTVSDSIATPEPPPERPGLIAAYSRT